MKKKLVILTVFYFASAYSSFDHLKNNPGQSLQAPSTLNVNALPFNPNRLTQTLVHQQPMAVQSQPNHHAQQYGHVGYQHKKSKNQLASSSHWTMSENEWNNCTPDSLLCNLYVAAETVIRNLNEVGEMAKQLPPQDNMIDLSRLDAIRHSACVASYREQFEMMGCGREGYEAIVYDMGTHLDTLFKIRRCLEEAIRSDVRRKKAVENIARLGKIFVKDVEDEGFKNSISACSETFKEEIKKSSFLSVIRVAGSYWRNLEDEVRYKDYKLALSAIVDHENSSYLGVGGFVNSEEFQREFNEI